MNRGELQVPPWTSNASVTGGFLFESTLHLFDMVRYLFGEVRRIVAVGSKSVYPCVDDFSMIFEMRSGAHGVFSSCAHATWVFPFERVEAYGEHAAMCNDEMEAVRTCLGLGMETVERKFGTLPVEARWGYDVQDRIFVERVLGRYQGPADFADESDGLRNVELMESVYEQIGLGK
jgi:myo-inositol 2-dehydrogenase/D-chiro-inositol 1-dehydrogenase